MRPLISIIIPIYNVEKYLARAIESVKNQTYSNLEIILVDDGSPDQCGEICDEYASHDARIKVIHKENGGLSDARNAGLDVMNGEYVMFLDSDDYYAPYMVEELYCAVKQTESEVAFCQYAVVKKEDNSELETKLRRPVRAEFPKPQEMYVYNKEDVMYYLYDEYHEDATFFIVAWNKIYLSSLWENVRFPKGKIHEDEATTYKIFDAATKVAYVNVPMYGYFEAPKSITRGKFSKKRLDWLEALSDRITYFMEQKEKDYAIPAFRARADGAIKFYYMLKEQVKDSKKEQEQLKKYVKEALEADQKYNMLETRTKLGYHLFLVSPALYKKALEETS